jgi:23S rRNA (adenine1618-N6)-methyltransferase
VIKGKLHSRNKHSGLYDFPKLILDTPELSKFMIKNKFNNEDTIDFSNNEAIKCLNRALLKTFYQVGYWDIPPQYLCPPIPGRADYLHYAFDLFKTTPKTMLDIGVGANCVYPLIAHADYGVSVVGSEVDEVAVTSAKNIVEKNHLGASIEIRQQSSMDHIFQGIIKPDEHFDLVVCNPPFHQSESDAKAQSARKNKNLNLKNQLNFKGVPSELWCRGGEVGLIKKMINESKIYKNQLHWVTSLVSSKENLPFLYEELKKAEASLVKTFEMSQGQKVSRFIAWTFRN